VVLLSGAGRGYVAALLAIWRAGGVAVPLSPALPEAECEYVCTDSDASLALVEPAYEDRFLPTSAMRHLRVIRTTSAAPSGDLPPIDNGPALILYTSGTTSRPKGVVLTHANLEFQTRCLCHAWAWCPDDRILHVLPLNHVHGIVNALLCALRAGASCEMLPRFDAGRVWSRLADGNVTLFMAVPTIYVRLIAAFDAADGESRARWASGARRARLMVSGSAALPVTVLERWKAMTGHVLLERYGMTEIGMALSNPLHGERRPGTVGQPLPGVDVRLCGDVESDATPAESGEIHVRSEGVFAEYWRRPKETAAAFAENGWFRTGDMAALDDGSYRILGRLSVDIIKTGGEKVSALEIEEVLREHPAVADCAVVGVAHPEWGEQVCAAFVLRSGHTLTLEALRTWAGTHLSRCKLPGRLVVVSDLPRNALGKVVKGEVRGMFMQGPGTWDRGPGAAPQESLRPGTQGPSSPESRDPGAGPTSAR
jgi:malonyl-CoA/methylmalonyl-CoA synthetase